MHRMEKRTLGKTGEKLSIVGFGGIVVMNEEPSNASMIVSRAIERGINYFDVAPSYGNAQERLGPALAPYRRNVFLACKTLKRTKDEAKKELYDSLEKLRTDYFDLYQHHGVTTIEEVERIMSPGGAMEAFIEAKNKGLIRYVGFTAHSEEATISLMDLYNFDTILFPFNWACWYKDNFGPAVLERAIEKGLGILALKALAKRVWEETEERKWPKCWYSPVDDFDEATLALKFTLSLPVTSAVSPSHEELLWWACDIAEKFTPITNEESELLRTRSYEVKTIKQGLKFN